MQLGLSQVKGGLNKLNEKTLVNAQGNLGFFP